MKTILIVEDHPILLETYIYLIKNSYNKYCEIKFVTATNCKDAIQNINLISNNNDSIDYAIVDINLPPFNEIKSGLDLVLEIKKKHNNCKTLVLTAFTNPLPIYNLINRIDVEMIVCKSDIDVSFFEKLPELVINTKTYISESIKKEIKLIAKKKIDLDEIDLEIIQRLSEGVKTKNIPDYISISLSSIEKRKARMKLLFLDSNLSDKNLLERMRKLGLISTVKS
jgi:DNA-binding NarL/FixJ family response regulator